MALNRSRGLSNRARREQDADQEDRDRCLDQAETGQGPKGYDSSSAHGPVTCGAFRTTVADSIREEASLPV